MKILVTGGAGFIGSALVRYLIAETADSVIVVDKLTYAGNLSSLAPVSESQRYAFERTDICDRRRLEGVFARHKPEAVIHLAAESHVDRSIDGPAEFIRTNLVGTFTLLEVAREFWQQLTPERQETFRLHHVSTDEVYGDLGFDGPAAGEDTPYAPSSPYSASKAGADHLVRAWRRTYGLPVVLTNCSNNYGPYQYPEKFIPLVILNACDGQPLPVYGTGNQVRDWLYVDDHVRALYRVLTQGRIGETYNIGGDSPKQNIEVVASICTVLEELLPTKPTGVVRYSDLIEHVADRPGHDLRYAINANRIRNELGWAPEETFDTGLRKTVEWFLSHRGWCEDALAGDYDRQRLGLTRSG